MRPRRFAQVFMTLALLAGVPARADETLPPEPPRWRLRAALVSGVGGSSDGRSAVTVFPTTLELGARLYQPLSMTLQATGVLVGEEYQVCGNDRRPNAILGAAGLRVDLNNRHSDSWLSPFIEAHAGVGRQGPPREENGVCSGAQVFATGGAKLGLDVWLGKVAVTVVAAYDYLPTAMPVSASVGATFVLY